MSDDGESEEVSEEQSPSENSDPAYDVDPLAQRNILINAKTYLPDPLGRALAQPMAADAPQTHMDHDKVSYES